MQQSFFVNWLHDVLRGIVKLVFYFPSSFRSAAVFPFIPEPNSLLIFVQFGAAMTIFALSQLHSAQNDSRELEKKITSRDPDISPMEIRFHQNRRRFWALLHQIRNAGVFFFVGTFLQLIRMTYSVPNPNQAAYNRTYVVLSNLVFGATFIATGMVVQAFLKYRLRLIDFSRLVKYFE